jgi:hypothetical protein
MMYRPQLSAVLSQRASRFFSAVSTHDAITGQVADTVHTVHELRQRLEQIRDAVLRPQFQIAQILVRHLPSKTSTTDC